MQLLEANDCVPGSGDTEIGMSRLSLSDADKQARDWFAEMTKALGCKVTVDAMGNQFAVRPGLQEGHPGVYQLVEVVKDHGLTEMPSIRWLASGYTTYWRPL